jgi:hypothetical protein
MIAVEKAIQGAVTAARRSVHQTSFWWALVQEVVRSTTQRLPTAMGAGFPRVAVSPRSPCSMRPCRVQTES